MASLSFKVIDSFGFLERFINIKIFSWFTDTKISSLIYSQFPPPHHSILSYKPTTCDTSAFVLFVNLTKMMHLVQDLGYRAMLTASPCFLSLC